MAFKAFHGSIWDTPYINYNPYKTCVLLWGANRGMHAHFWAMVEHFCAVHQNKRTPVFLDPESNTFLGNVHKKKKVVHILVYQMVLQECLMSIH